MKMLTKQKAPEEKHYHCQHTFVCCCANIEGRATCGEDNVAARDDDG